MSRHEQARQILQDRLDTHLRHEKLAQENLAKAEAEVAKVNADLAEVRGQIADMRSAIRALES